jgi:hypothetical protein
MRIRTTLIVLASALAAANAQAALKEQPPEGVRLTGTWQLDSQRSDDPAQVIEKAEKAEAANHRRQIEERDRGADRSWGDENDGPWNDRNDGLPGDRHGRRDPFPGRRDDGVILDPTGRDNSVTWSTGTARRRTASDEFLLQLDPNPQTLTIQDWGSRLLVWEDKLDTDCRAGEVAPIADAFGDGERQCGWRGRAWVIETRRTDRFKRTDRFELSKDGQQLAYTSTATGSDIPSIKVSRVYRLAPPARQ